VGCGQQSLHAHAQQYASRVLGRLYVHGLQFWQLGDSHYWGHNAILRVEPFMTVPPAVEILPDRVRRHRPE